MKDRKKEYKRSQHYVPKEYLIKDLAYLAGIIDGEGCFYIGSIKRMRLDGQTSSQYRGILTITNCDRALPDWLINHFPGFASAVTRATSSRKYERLVYSWVCSGDYLLDLCEAVLPYLVLKQKQCQLMIEFRKTYIGRRGGGNARAPQEIIDLRCHCYKTMHHLNSRFHLHPLKNNS